jgi:hypothetical protein
MFHYEMPSVGKEIKKLEGENPWSILSSLKEERKTLEDRVGTDEWSPDDRVLFIQLTEKIDLLQENLNYKNYKKAA